ncbi:MAG: hypothetical protein QOI24_1256 [Acidobacteriota bacterium]|jgi:hypothetical protein|nr:hypothetical protein [Acidobacteriota bacterium]
MDSEDIPEFLRTLEVAETALLGWGLVDGFFASRELEERADAFLAQRHSRDGASEFGSGWDLVEALLDAQLLWKLPNSDRYRTRMSEGVRLFASLRQIFPDPQLIAWRTAPTLVADYRFMLRRRLYPRRDLAPDDLFQFVRQDTALSAGAESVARAILTSGGDVRGVSGFQARTMRRLLNCATDDSVTGTVISAGTGSGKTLAFYLPAFALMFASVSGDYWTKVLAIYPRNELLKDQLREALVNARKMRPVLHQHGKRSLAIGALYGDVPKSGNEVLSEEKWRRVQIEGGMAYVCPFVLCPTCSEPMGWLRTDLERGVERLICVRRGCGDSVGSDEIRLTRSSMFSAPPDILFTSTEMLNQRLASSRYARLLGIGLRSDRRPQFLLLDEAHSYEGVHGAHVAMLIRRWRRLSNAQPHFVGLSATLADAPRFFADLVGIGPGSVAEITPLSEEMTASDAEYLLALRGDPSSGTSLLSTTIQASMLLRRIIAPRAANAFFGSKVFVFTDDLDVTNRLYFNLLDAEGWDSFGRRNTRPTGSLANLRSHVLPASRERLDAGQNWELVERCGHLLASGVQVRVGRTSSQDTGVSADADIVVATSTLEVGLDDPEVGAVLQHKSPHSSAAFLQRKGRAGRRRGTRPWTVVVLSDFGRDRAAYQSYDQLFSPSLPPRHLPLGNRAVLRMQAALVLLEWLARRVSATGDPWADFSQPARDSESRSRHQAYLRHLVGFLESEAARSEFAEHLQRTLFLDEWDTRSVLWDGPRSIFMEAVPTLLRRLEAEWQRADGSSEPFSFWKPLPEFIPSSLFSDLLLPEVSVRVPAFGASMAHAESMPLIQALRDFAPGRVSRRFGTYHSGQRHWVPPGTGGVVTIDSFCRAGDRQNLGSFRYAGENTTIAIRTFKPLALDLTACPPDVQQSSNSMLDWRTELVLTGDGTDADLPTPSSWDSILRSLRFHTHHTASPIELRRFAVGATATIGRGTGRPVEQYLRFVESSTGAEAEPVALGFVADVDAIEVVFAYPRPLHELCAADDRLSRSMRAARFRSEVRQSPHLNGIANIFQRDLVAQAYLSSIVTEALRGGTSLESAEAAIHRDVVFGMLRQVLETLFQWDDSDGGTPGGAQTVPRRLDELTHLIATPECRAVLHEAALMLWRPINEEWETFLRARFKATLGAAFVEAAHNLCPRMETGALSVELHALRTPAVAQGDAGATDTIWLSENTIGGGGFVEEFLSRYTSDPRTFVRFLDAAVSASDLEVVGDELCRILQFVSSLDERDIALSRAFSDLRTADSYRDIAEAVLRLRARLTERGVTPISTLLVSLNARVLQQGTSDATDQHLGRLVRDWVTAEQVLGVDIDARVFALALSGNPDLELALQVSPPSDPDSQAAASWRYSVLHGLLWPRGAQVRAGTLVVPNQFATSEDCDRLLVTAALRTRRPRVELAAVDWFEQMGDEIVEHGSVELAARTSAAQSLSDAILRVASEPIDSEILLTHARLVGLRRDGLYLIAEFDLPEAFQ